MLSIFDPFADLNRLHRDFERSVQRTPSRAGADFAPPVDVHEEKDAYVLRAELPGIKREDIEISLEENVLTIKGERRFEKQEEGKRYHRVERSYGSFVRYFQLPKMVDAEHVEASLQDGVLSVRVPKQELVKARKIDVKA
jgi:HSP20 family protein